MALFILLMFMIMIMFGGIAVDVMRYETRRVAMQQTMDRAALAAASVTQKRPAAEIAQEWFDKTGLGDELVMVDYSAPVITTEGDEMFRRVTISAKVRSYNFFMHLLNVDYLEGPTNTEAAQGVSKTEVMLVLDVTGSMGGSAGNGKTKIEALREAAQEFVTIVKENDSKNGISIGMVPYAAQVNIPAALRQQFNVTNISTWDGVANAGVPNINCIEIPTSTYDTAALSLTSPMPMAAVADSSSSTTSTSDYILPTNGVPVITSRACTTPPDNGSTAYNDEEVNHVFLPTKDGEAVKTRISRLTAAGNTSIALGMRWGSALLDQAARPIYTAIADDSVKGRPADNIEANPAEETRKIIILMTDGSHVTNTHVLDAYKTGLSPIWRGTDGRYAIRFAPDGTAATDGTRPTNCSGWSIPTSALREYFVPHLKRNSVRQRVNSAEPEGLGTGTSVTGACDPRAWLTDPTWPLLDVSGNPVLNASGLPVMVVSTRQDWSEVWRYLRVSYVVRQLYMRSGVTGTTNYTTLMDMFRATYLSSVSNLDSLLQQNCVAARAAGIEVFGIAFAAPTSGQAQINGCASSPKSEYYFNATDGDVLTAAFRSIATIVSDLRLTQ